MPEYNDLSKFYNPYHFVRLGNDVKRSEDTLEERIQADVSQLYTGKINVVLKTKTPLFIPNVPEYEKKEKVAPAGDPGADAGPGFRPDRAAGIGACCQGLDQCAGQGRR